MVLRFGDHVLDIERRAGLSTTVARSSASFAPCSAGVCALSARSAKTANRLQEKHGGTRRH